MHYRSSAFPSMLKKHFIPLVSAFGVAGLVVAALPALGANAEPVSLVTDQQLVSDNFTRPAADSWGSAAQNMPYSYVGAQSFEQDGKQGIVDLAKPGSLRSASVPAVAALDAVASNTITLPALPKRGKGVYSGLHLRSSGGSDYQAIVRIDPSGALFLKISRTDGSAQNQTSMVSEKRIAGKLAAGGDIHFEFQATGTSPVALRAKAWVDSSAEPEWQAVAEDASSKRIQAKGSVSVSNYLSTGSNPLTVAVDDFTVASLKAASAPTPVATNPATMPEVTKAPTAAPEAGTPAPTPVLTVPVAPAPAPSEPAPATQAPAPKPAPPATTPAVAGAVSPGGFSTGVPSGVKLQVHEGDLVVTTPGQVIDGLDIRGLVTIKADGVVIKNSRISGTSASSSKALVSNYSSGKSFTIMDSELVASTGTPWINGIMGSNFTAERVNVHGVIDAIHITGGNVQVKNAWLHDNLHFEVDPNHNNTPSHDDSIQIGGGSNIEIADSWLEDANNAAVMITQDVSRTSNVRFTSNHLDGGDCTINVSDKGKGAITGLEINKNTFGLNRTISYCAVLAPASSAPAMTGNVWQATGQTATYVKK